MQVEFPTKIDLLKSFVSFSRFNLYGHLLVFALTISCYDSWGHFTDMD